MIVTCQIRKENQDFNNNRINEAKSEGELWKIANDVVKPKSNESIKLNINDILVDDKSQIAEEFNKYLVEKINLLKLSIDPELKVDPLMILKKKMEGKCKKKISFKKVSENKLRKIMKKLRKKRVPDRMELARIN